MSSATRLLVVAALTLGCFLTPAVAAYAYWSTTATATVTVSTSAAPAAPGAPTGVTCTGKGTPQTLSWNAVTGATEYRVYRTSDLSSPVRTATSTSTQLTEQQMGNPQQPSQFYDVVVRAWNEGGESPSSATVELNFKGNKSC